MGKRTGPRPGPIPPPKTLHDRDTRRIAELEAELAAERDELLARAQLAALKAAGEWRPVSALSLIHIPEPTRPY